jgi:hypothetical protein
MKRKIDRGLIIDQILAWKDARSWDTQFVPRRDTGTSGGRVVVLYEPGRSGLAALDLARRLVAGDGSMLTVVTVAPQDARMRCGAGSAVDYNQAVCEAAGAELREAHERLGPVGDRALFQVLVQDRNPPLADWVASGDYDVVLLPARTRPLRRAWHPAAGQLRASTRAEVRVIDAASSLDELGIEILAGSSTRAQDRHAGAARQAT